MAENNLPSKRKRTLNPKLTSEDNVHEDAVKRRQAQFHTKTPVTTSHSSRQASVEGIDDPDDHIRRNAGHPKNPNSILEDTDDEPPDAASQHSVKRQKQTNSHTKTVHTAGQFSRQASVEAIDDPDDHIRRNAGRPKKPNSILEGTDDEEDKGYQHALKRRKAKLLHTKTVRTAGQSSRQASVEVIDDPDDHIRRNAGRPKNPNSILEGTDNEEDEIAATEDIEGPELQEETDEQELGMIAIQNLLDTS